jgi:ubiquinone/menaquinone biosynthesis C-methylase UbiE
MTPGTNFHALGASTAFSLIAERYDETFTHTTIGKAQRRVVWDALTQAFSSGNHILELNCGTGEDALFLARRGISVTACDASPTMIAIAKRRKALESAKANLDFRVLAIEELRELRDQCIFDGAFSNFSGFNCVADIREVASSLGLLLKPGSHFLVCLSTRVCLWEILWYLGHGNLRKAFRRTAGHTIARMEGVSVPVWYPTIGRTRRMLAPWFRLRAVRAVGLFVPPSYVEHWAQQHERLIAGLVKMDQFFARFPILRGLGDHVLLEFERVQS